MTRREIFGLAAAPFLPALTARSAWAQAASEPVHVHVVYAHYDAKSALLRWVVRNANVAEEAVGEPEGYEIDLREAKMTAGSEGKDTSRGFDEREADFVLKAMTEGMGRLSYAVTKTVDRFEIWPFDGYAHLHTAEPKRVWKYLEDGTLNGEPLPPRTRSLVNEFLRNVLTYCGESTVWWKHENEKSKVRAAAELRPVGSKVYIWKDGEVRSVTRLPDR